MEHLLTLRCYSAAMHDWAQPAIRFVDLENVLTLLAEDTGRC